MSGFCVCGFVGSGSQAQGLIMQRCVGEVVLDEPGSSVGYAILYAPRHDVLNTASLGAYFSLIIACFSVLKHDVLNAASLGEVCCHVLLLNKSNTSLMVVCAARERRKVMVCTVYRLTFFG